MRKQIVIIRAIALILTLLTALCTVGLADDRLNIAESSPETDDTNPLAVLCPDGGYCNIFHSITCIGDSLTAGVHEHNEDAGHKEYTQCPDYSYPTFMSRALGITVNNLSAGGLTVKGYLARANKNNYFSAYKTDAYIIALGTNDSAGNVNISGDISDIDTENPANTDTSTVVGAYGKIIQNIYAEVPKAKIFVVCIPHTRNSDRYIADFNTHLKEIAELLNCYVIDLETYGVQSADETSWKSVWYLGGHLNTLGYRQLAVWMMSYIDWIIRHNMDDFAQTAFIQTEYSFSVTPSIAISSQPSDVTAEEGCITNSLSVVGKVKNGLLSYQWYENTENSNTGGTAITGETSANMALDTTLTVGSYYYYCVLSCIGAEDVISDCVTVTVHDAPAYLAKYTLSGTPNASAPATIADESGNGNTLTVNSISSYDANGYLKSDAENESLFMATVNLNGKTKYKLHFELGQYTGTGRNRIFALGGMDLSLQLGEVCLQVETSESIGFASPVQTTNYKASGNMTSRDSVYKNVFDWIVDGDTITINATLYGTPAMIPYTSTVTFTCTGFTTALTTGGIYLCNRADGTRPAYAPLINFYIVEVPEEKGAM